MTRTLLVRRRAILVPVLLAGVLTVAAPAHAHNYPVEIDVSSEREIWELFYAEDIDDVDRDRLLDLWDRGVPINSADRIDFYELPGVTRGLARKLVAVRKKQGGYKAITDLMAVLPADVYTQCEPFLRYDDSFDILRELDLTTKVRFMVVTADASDRFSGSLADDVDVEGEYSPSDVTQRSSAVLAAEVNSGKGWDAGVSVLTRQLVSDYDGSDPDGPIISPGNERVVDLDKIYVRGAGDLWEVVLGSHLIGFGLGLTIKDVSKRRLRGIYLPRPPQASDSGGLSGVGAPLGIAAMVRTKEAGPGWLTGHVFASRTTDDLFQNDFQPNQAVLDRTDADGEEIKLSSSTFRDATSETRAGGALTYSLAKGRLFGVTGWTAESEFNDLPGRSFAQGSHLPPSGRYNAGGAFLNWDLDDVELLAEVTLATASCDERKIAWDGRPAAACEGGQEMSDVGVVGQILYEPTSTVDLFLDGWYYGPKFLNPHGSAPQASAQERLGNRNRNQAGGRLRAKYKPTSDLELRGEAAVWTALEPHVESLFTPDEVSSLPAGVGTPSCARSSKDGQPRDLDPRCEDVTDMKLAGRVTQRLTPSERLMVALDFADESLDDTGRLQDFEDDKGGSRVRAQTRVTTTRLPRTKLELGLLHAWIDRTLRDCPAPGEGGKCARADLAAVEEFDTDLSVFGTARIDTSPGPKVVLTGRLWDYERRESFDGNGNFKTGPQRGETSFVGSVTLNQKLGKRLRLGLRWKFETLLDGRPDAPGATTTTKERQETEHFAKLVLDAKF